MIVRNCYIGGLGDFLMVETSNSHSLKRERVFWLTVCRSFVCSQLTQRRGGMAEGPGGGETAHHTGRQEAGRAQGRRREMDHLPTAECLTPSSAWERMRLWEGI